MRRKSGSVWPHGHDYLYESQRAVARKAGVKWKQNALRHSFISYRMAMVKDANQVALEAGNSPDIIFRNYLELVTRNAGRELVWNRTGGERQSDFDQLGQLNPNGGGGGVWLFKGGFG